MNGSIFGLEFLVLSRKNCLLLVWCWVERAVASCLPLQPHQVRSSSICCLQFYCASGLNRCLCWGHPFGSSSPAWYWLYYRCVLYIFNALVGWSGFLLASPNFHPPHPAHAIAFTTHYNTTFITRSSRASLFIAFLMHCSVVTVKLCLAYVPCSYLNMIMWLYNFTL